MNDDDYLDVSLLMTDSFLFWCSVQSEFPDVLFSPMSFCLAFFFHDQAFVLNGFDIGYPEDEDLLV